MAFALARGAGAAARFAARFARYNPDPSKVFYTRYGAALESKLLGNNNIWSYGYRFKKNLLSGLGALGITMAGKRKRGTSMRRRRVVRRKFTRPGTRMGIMKRRGTKRRMPSIASVGRKRARVARPSQTRRITTEYSTYVAKSRRPRPVSTRIAKALVVDHRILRWQLVSRLNGANTGTGNPPGNIWLLNDVPATGNSVAPVAVFDLNNTLNTATQYGVGFLLQFTQAGLTAWSALNSQKADGTTSGNNNWQVEYGDNSSTALNKRYYSPRWYDIRLMCHGAINQPTQFEVLVVRFRKDHLVPAFDGFGAAQPETTAEYHGFWQGMAKALTYNPVIPRQNRGVIEKGMYVMKRLTFLLPAAQTTDSDKNPACRSVRLFVPDGRLLCYQAATPYYTADDGVFNNSWQVVNPSSGTRYDYPISQRARTFLIVRAMNTTVTNGTGSDMTNTPSFDVVIRKKESYDAH